MELSTSERIFRLTNKQYKRRFIFLGFLAASGYGAILFMHGYSVDRERRFIREYDDLRSNPNFFHTLHEQVAIGFQAKQHEKSERKVGITDMRKKLISKANGLVLETAIGHNLNIAYYDFSKIKKLFGCDWVDSSLDEASKRVNDQDVTLFNCDSHKMPFGDESFDTVVDTFGLECAYDLDRQYKEMKRVTKRGGHILLLERGKSFWLFDNFMLMLKLSVNLSARGQIYNHDYSKIFDCDPEVKVIKRKRKRRGTIYIYDL